LYSEVLEEMVGPVYVSATGLRDIDKFGGLDRYLINNPLKRTKWEGGIKNIRKRVLEEIKRKGKEKNVMDTSGE
jgi:ribosomal protein L28